MQKAFILFGLMAGICLNASSQENQIAAVLGAKVTPEVGNAANTGVTSVNPAFAIEFNAAHQLKKLPLASFQVELPFILGRQSKVTTGNLFASQSYGSFFLTPGVKLQLAPKAPLSPWVAAGVGLARFSPSVVTLQGQQSAAKSTTKLAFDGGAGVDFKVPFIPLTFRVQARELYTGTPNLGVRAINLRNNVLVGGGVVLNF